MVEQMESIGAALEAVEQILQNGAEVLFDCHLESQVSPFISEECLDMGEKVIQILLLQRDEGETADAKENSEKHDWVFEDDEPQAAIADVAASQCVRINRVIPKKKLSIPTLVGHGRRRGSILSTTKRDEMEGARWVAGGEGTFRTIPVDPIGQSETKLKIDQLGNEMRAIKVQEDREEINEMKKKTNLQKDFRLKERRIAATLAGKKFTTDYNGNALFLRPV